MGRCRSGSVERGYYCWGVSVCQSRGTDGMGLMNSDPSLVKRTSRDEGNLMIRKWIRIRIIKLSVIHDLNDYAMTNMIKC
jgi:hypothetical protein